MVMFHSFLYVYQRVKQLNTCSARLSTAWKFPATWSGIAGVTSLAPKISGNHGWL
jgi:hypothetical protein